MSTLGEIVVAGTAHAVAALDKMLGVAAQVSTPVVGAPAVLRGLDDVRGHGTIVRLDIPSFGALLMILDDAAAARWVRALVGNSPRSPELDEVELSALAELVNILGSRFLAIMGDKIQRKLIPSPPALRSGDLHAMLDDELVATAAAVVASNRFDAERGVCGRFVLATRAAGA